MIDLQDKHSLTVMTECKCPRCGRIHKVRMEWTGIGMARIYCQKCKGVINQGDYIGSMNEYTGVVL